MLLIGFFVNACSLPGSTSIPELVPSSAPNDLAERKSTEQRIVPRASLSAPVNRTGEAWRFGFDMAEVTDADFWAEKLGAMWYLDWQVLDRSPKVRVEHWQTVRLSETGFRPDLKRIQALAERYPGSVWLIGNEPDAILQDNISPERYAEHYHTLYQAIKALDPSARLAAGNIAQASPLRLAYLDRVLIHYREVYDSKMPVDLWAIHGYILREQRDSWGVGIPPGMETDEGWMVEVADHGRLDLLEAQIWAFRRWMDEHGYRARPLVITEYGILMPRNYGFPASVVQAYMLASFDMFRSLQDESLGLEEDNNRLVQQWAWFSLSSTEFPTGDLVDLVASELTPLGEAYRGYVSYITSQP
jgi:hypothetical protein